MQDRLSQHHADMSDTPYGSRADAFFKTVEDGLLMDIRYNDGNRHTTVFCPEDIAPLIKILERYQREQGMNEGLRFSKQIAEIYEDLLERGFEPDQAFVLVNKVIDNSYS